jgi:hypothetical protein
MESVTTIWFSHQSTSTTPSGNRTFGLLKANMSSTVQLPRVVQLLTDFATVTTTTTATAARQAYSTSAFTSSSQYTWNSTPTAQLPAMPTPDTSRLSPSTALGIGFAAGIIGIVVLLSAVLFVYRCWKVRRSPAVQDYEKARLWKGFTPATPSTARNTLVDSKTANMYFTEVQSPSTPAFMWNPPPDRRGQRWSAATWTPGSPPAELSV